jgi:hypothetical protein
MNLDQTHSSKNKNWQKLVFSGNRQLSFGKESPILSKKLIFLPYYNFEQNEIHTIIGDHDSVFPN